MTPPLWFLDVDGVVNAITDKIDKNIWGPADQWVFTKAEAGGNLWPIRAASPVLDFIRHVHACGAAEIQWHTTWQTEAHGLADLLDLPRFEVTDAPEYAAWGPRARGWWKLPAVQRAVAAGRTVVWTDDDLKVERRRHNGTELAILDQLDTMCLISPSVYTGLTPKHVRRIGEFLGVDVAAPVAA